MHIPELLAPAGNWESLQAAIQAGADSIYFGIDKLNMRVRAAHSFTIKDLKKITSLCHKQNIKAYLTVNSVVYDPEIKEMQTICKAAKAAKIDAIIAHDLAVLTYAKKLGLRVHLSTQANISNYDALKFYRNYADAVILARELSLEQIKDIIRKIRKDQLKGTSGQLMKVEIFIHGALCVSISGKCYMSLANYNHSANRGDCLQTCRRKYRVFDEETDQELIIDNQYVMSPKDLCTITILDKLIEADILKIEGRGRSADYVHTVTKIYRQALEDIKAGKFSRKKGEEYKKELEKVFNRGFWEGGYYLGEKTGEWAGIYGSKASEVKEYVGKVENYYSQKKVVMVSLESGKIRKGDKVLIIGPTTGVLELKITGVKEEGKLALFEAEEKVRKNDKVYVVTKRV
jgi:putative protease